MVATINLALLKQSYDGYPKQDPTHLVTGIYNVKVLVSTGNAATREYFGTCNDQYQGN